MNPLKYGVFKMSKIRIYSRISPISYVEWEEKDIWTAVEHIDSTKVDINLLLKEIPNIFQGYKDSISDQERVKNANLDYPIIVARQGDKFTVLDGFHRIYRAREARMTEIDVKYIIVAPEPTACVGNRVIIPGLEYKWTPVK